MKIRILTVVALAAVSAFSLGQTVLGAFTFNNSQFGDTLVEMDGGAFSAANWLNTTNVDPGNPGYLTGVNFETGVANIPSGIGYRIFYNTPIVNGIGDDLGVVVARFSTDDFTFAVTEDSTNWSVGVTIPGSTGVATGVGKDYYYQGGGPYPSELFVHAIDLSNFGVLLGNSVQGVEVGGLSQLDLIRVAGFGIVPEPSSLVLLAGLSLVGLARKRRTR